MNDRTTVALDERSLDETHDPAAQSWLESANAPDTDFPIQNLPFGRFRHTASEPWRIGVAIGDEVLDLQQAGLVDHLYADTHRNADMDMHRLMRLAPLERRQLRRAIFHGLNHAIDAHRDIFKSALVSQSQVEMGLPCEVGDYTDFYIGIHHATAVGRQFRPDQPLMPNYKWVPIGYHGRASTLLPGGASFRRPQGQVLRGNAQAPVLAPSERLDMELELGVFIGQPSAAGTPVSMTNAEDHIFGLTLFNDWSARDIQRWEYQPLGPFLSKNFASTVSPWMVTLDALIPFRAPFQRPVDDPQPLPYLDSEENRAHGVMDIHMQVVLQTARMAQAGYAGDVISRSSFGEAAYWTLAQLVAHHTVNGCALRAGDLFGTGTLSGPLPEQAGSLLELTAGGTQPLTLSNGELRSFLQDGDTIILRAHCDRPDARRIGFGECRGTVLPCV